MLVTPKVSDLMAKPARQRVSQRKVFSLEQEGRSKDTTDNQ